VTVNDDMPAAPNLPRLTFPLHYHPFHLHRVEQQQHNYVGVQATLFFMWGGYLPLTQTAAFSNKSLFPVVFKTADNYHLYLNMITGEYPPPPTSVQTAQF